MEAAAAPTHARKATKEYMFSGSEVSVEWLSKLIYYLSLTFEIYLASLDNGKIWVIGNVKGGSYQKL